MNTFCTLFDKNYMLYGLALHHSLMRHAGDFHLYMLAMDKTCESALRTLALDCVTVVSLDEIITEPYAFIRDRMSFGQMCWTSQPLLCKYVLDHHRAGAVTYLEADSYFFGAPKLLFDEVGDRSVSLVPHNYSPEHDQTATSGIFCVQFNLFRNDTSARDLLQQWESACLQYDKSRSGYYPGQLCMDSWPQQSPAVCVVKHLGAGVAPWNVSRFRVGVHGTTPTVDDVGVVFYHFHELSFTDAEAFFLSSYPLPAAAITHIYRPYLVVLTQLVEQVRQAIPGFEHRKVFRSPGLWNSLASLNIRQIRNYLKIAYLSYKGRKNFVRLDA